MLFLQLCLLGGLLVACSFVPGFVVVRRLRWTPLEKLCGSIGLSLALIYLVTWTVYVLGPQNQRAVYWFVVAIVLLLGFAVRQHVLRLIRTFRVRQAILGYGVLLLGVLLMLSMIRVYSGAGWAGDWVEHFQRSLVFLYGLAPEGQSIYGNYTLAARPPMMNVIGAFFLGLAGERHELFQALFACLNTLLILPCFLLLPALGGARRRYVAPLVALFVSSPIVMVNVTYTWTKALTVFYVVLALSLYLAGLRKNDNTRITAAFFALAPAILVHYSAGPYVIFLALHYLVQFLRRRPRPWRQLAAIAIVCSVFLASWFVWSLAVYGPSVTMSSNTAVTMSTPYRGRNLEKIGWNLYASIVPLRLRGDALPFPAQLNPAAAIRDEAFMLYQLNLIFGMGLIGGPLVLWLFVRRFGRARDRLGKESRFWTGMIMFCAVLGIAVVGEKDIVGVPHLTLLTIQILGLALLAARFSSFTPTVRSLLIVGCLIDFAFGVFLQARVESLENTATQSVFGTLQFDRGNIFVRRPEPDGLRGAVWNNWAAKHQYATAQKYLRDMPVEHAGDAEFAKHWPEMSKVLHNVESSDSKFWGGWFSRHGGVLTYLGDWIAGESGRGADVAALLFALFFIAIVRALVRFQHVSPR